MLKAEKRKKIGIFIVLIISLFAVSSYFNLFTVIGSDTERVMNSNTIELHMYPESFSGYCGDGGASCTSAYRLVCNPYEYSRPESVEYNCQSWSIPGAERKLIGNFCTEHPILQIYSATANIHFEDFFGTGTYPPFYVGTTTNNELSNEDSTILSTYIYSGTNYPTKDLGLDPSILTEYVKGTNCFNLYAVGGYYKKNVRSGMDATINYIDINYNPIECQTDIDCDDGRTDTVDSCFEYTCNNIDKTVVDKSTFKSILLGGGISFVIMGIVMLVLIGILFIMFKK